MKEIQTIKKSLLDLATVCATDVETIIRDAVNVIRWKQIEVVPETIRVDFHNCTPTKEVFEFETFIPSLNYRCRYFDSLVWDAERGEFDLMESSISLKYEGCRKWLSLAQINKTNENAKHKC